VLRIWEGYGGIIPAQKDEEKGNANWLMENVDKIASKGARQKSTAKNVENC
jgi:hypothetical protein